MNVLVLTNMYPPHHYGGYELSCRDVVDRFRARGHEVTVLTSTVRVAGVADPPDERARGVRRDLSLYWDDHRLLSPPVWRRAAIERTNHAALRSALADAQPDVVSVWNMGAMSLGLLTSLIEHDVPIAYNVYDDWLVYGPKLDAWTRLFRRRPRLARAVRARTGVPTTLPDFPRAGTYCFMSDYIRMRAQRDAGWTPERSTVVLGGIDEADFPPAVPHSKGWTGRLLYAGRIDDRKGIHVAIDALELLPNETTLDIVGRGDDEYRARLDTQIERLGVRDRVLFDVVERDELAARFVDADAFIFPVLWDEPFGLVPIEAMACATPVIATGTGGSAEFLEHEANCLLVPRGDARALAAAVRRLAAEPDLRARIVAGGLRTAHELTIDKMADALESWHKATAERFANGAPPERTMPPLKPSDSATW